MTLTHKTRLSLKLGEAQVVRFTLFNWRFTSFDQYLTTLATLYYALMPLPTTAFYQHLSPLVFSKIKYG